MTTLFAYKGIDGLFTVIRILTLLSCLAWPLLMFLAIMAFGGPTKSSVWVKLLWILALSYPVIFMFIIHVSEKYIAGAAYPVAVSVALIPILIVAFAAFKFFTHKGGIKKYEVVVEGHKLSVGYGLRTGAEGPEHEPIPVQFIAEAVTEDYVLKDREKEGYSSEDFNDVPNIKDIQMKEYKWGTHYSWTTPTYGSATYHYVSPKGEDMGFRVGPVNGTRNMDVSFYWDLVSF